MTSDLARGLGWGLTAGSVAMWWAAVFALDHLPIPLIVTFVAVNTAALGFFIRGEVLKRRERAEREIAQTLSWLVVRAAMRNLDQEEATDADPS